VSAQFVEVLIAPSYTPDALVVIAKKTNVRVLEIGLQRTYGATSNALDFKRVGGGMLVQSADDHLMEKSALKCVTQKPVSDAQLDDLLFAWRVAKFVKSNAIVFVKQGATVGIGAGQMSRLDSARIAGIKAGHAGLTLQGSVAASDAFFPFRDGLDVIADAGAIAVIQPGGSMRDSEVIAAADERGVGMVFTNVRHFRH
jgi:phosphoribosylaminoimidazolecarboxamide formyltransferase/IMP cyclohydrolase